MKAEEKRALEKLFAAEVAAATDKNGLPGLVQSKAEVFKSLEGQGLAEEVTITLSGRFSVNVTGWILTPAGHYAYCMTC